jgi:hypothetical protein
MFRGSAPTKNGSLLETMKAAIRIFYTFTVIKVEWLTVVGTTTYYGSGTYYGSTTVVGSGTVVPLRTVTGTHCWRIMHVL